VEGFESPKISLGLLFNHIHELKGLEMSHVILRDGAHADQSRIFPQTHFSIAPRDDREY